MGTFLLGTSVVMFVADGIHIHAGKGVLWPAVIIGCMTFGAALVCLFVASNMKR